jgi:hypothetical protein
MTCRNLTLGTFKLNSVFNPFERQAIQNNRKLDWLKNVKKRLSYEGESFKSIRISP